jgi:hypothetical protein
MMDFIRSILMDNGFVPEYIDTILCTDFLNQDDLDFYEKCKSRNIWKTRVFNKLGFKSFTKQSLNYWKFRGYNSVESRDMVAANKLKRTEPTPMQKQFWIDKGISNEDVQSKINSFRKTMPEYWMSRGFTNDEALNKITEYQKENSDKLKKKKIESPELFEDIRWNQKKYWIKKGLSEEESIKKVSELQNTFSLEKCIKKYGDAGMEIWKERQKKWILNYKKSNYSRISQVLFFEIITRWKNINNNSVYFAKYNNGFVEDDINHEYVISCSDRIIKPDFFVYETKKIIEFDGLYWHNHNKRNKPENTRRESERDSILLKEGYDILRICEGEYKSDKLETIKKCINFLET